MENMCEQVIHSRWEGRQGGSGVGVTMGSPWGPRRRSSVELPMGSYGQGSSRAASGTTLGVLGTSKMKENERFYGFTDFRGKPERRGRWSRGTANQVTAGYTLRSAHRTIIEIVNTTRIRSRISSRVHTTHDSAARDATITRTRTMLARSGIRDEIRYV